jgi:uncharacterized protein (TIGR02996 family)
MAVDRDPAAPEWNMSDDATFQKLLHEQPDDDASWLVYADWLESTGEPPRATIVRRLRELAGITEHVPRLACARKVLDAAKGFPREWLAKFPTRIALEGTCWGAHDCDGGVYLVVFAAGGKLLFMQGDAEDTSDEPDAERGDGKWMQLGDAMTFSIALHDDPKKDFSRQDGVLTGDLLGGIGSNSDGQIWTWSLAPVPIKKFRADRLPILPSKPKDSASHASGKDKHVLPRRRWK